MKSRHINNPSHTLLFQSIHEEVMSRLNFCAKRFNNVVLIKFCFYSVFTVVTYMSLFFIKNSFLYISTFIVYGIISLLFVFNFAHDFSHNTIFKRKRLNHYCFVVLYAIVGAHAEAWKDRHVSSHHHAPNVEGYDTDLEITNLIRVVPGSDLQWFHKFQHWYAPLLYTTYSLFWVFVKDFKIFFKKRGVNNVKTTRYQLSFWVQKVGYISYLLLIPLWFTNQSWYIVFTGFLAMHVVQSLFLLFTFFMTHHVENTFYPTLNDSGSIEVSWLMNQIQSSNDFYPFSKVANFIFGGFNNHIAHHLFPHIHHTYYPNLNKILYRILENNDVILNQTSYLGGVRSHLLHLRQLGRSK